MFWVIEAGSNADERIVSPVGDIIPFRSEKWDRRGGIYFVEWKRLLYALLVDLLADAWKTVAYSTRSRIPPRAAP
jgi:hypothetical protein